MHLAFNPHNARTFERLVSITNIRVLMLMTCSEAPVPSFAEPPSAIADQGNGVGQFRYGHCLEYGKGIPVDLIEAARCFKLSADQGNPNGQFNYGVCLEYGK
jgi:hypothetical protein